MTRKTLTVGIATIVKAFPSAQVDPDLWWAMLSDLKDEDMLRAVFRVIRSVRDVYPGTNWIALIREQAAKDDSPGVGEALAEVRREIDRVGHVGTPKWSHPRIGRAVEAIGWRAMCCSESPATERAHFIRVYESIGTRDAERKVVGQLPVEIQKLIGMVSGDREAPR